MTIGTFFDEPPLVDKDQWVSTGVLAFDRAIGRGWRRGCAYQVYGASGTRKSTLALVAQRAAQDAGMLAVYLDKENRFLEQVALLVGLDFRAPKMLLPRDAEYGWFGGRTNAISQEVKSGGFLIERGGSDTVEKTFLDIFRLCRACGRGGVSPFIVIDSVSSLTTQAEAKGGVALQRMDISLDKAKQIRKAYRLVLPALAKCRGVLLSIDHEMGMGSVSGGSAPVFFTAARLQVELDEEQPAREVGREAVALKVTTHKSTFTAQSTARIVFDYGVRGGIDRAADVLAVGKQVGFVTVKTGGNYTLADDAPTKQKRARGEANWRKLYAMLAKHPKWIAHKLDVSYYDTWVAWCKIGGISPREHLSQYTKEVQDRVMKQLAKLKIDIDATSDEVEEDLSAGPEEATSELTRIMAHAFDDVEEEDDEDEDGEETTS